MKNNNDNNDNIKDKLIFLEKVLNQFVNKYNKNKLIDIYNNDKSFKSLLISDEINNLELKLKLFNKHLNDIKIYIKSITHPDIKQYKSWNINQIIQWISSLDNGQFIDYIDVLRKGFLTDGIDRGEYLPDITKNDLRAQPFEIKLFPIRRDLEIHFKSLKTQKFQNNDNNQEGTVTEYH